MHSGRVETFVKRDMFLLNLVAEIGGPFLSRFYRVSHKVVCLEAESFFWRIVFEKNDSRVYRDMMWSCKER